MAEFSLADKTLRETAEYSRGLDSGFINLIEEFQSVTGVKLNVIRMDTFDPMSDSQWVVGIRDRFDNAIALKFDHTGKMSICNVLGEINAGQ